MTYNITSQIDNYHDILIEELKIPEPGIDYFYSKPSHNIFASTEIPDYRIHYFIANIDTIKRIDYLKGNQKKAFEKNPIAFVVAHEFKHLEQYCSGKLAVDECGDIFWYDIPYRLYEISCRYESFPWEVEANNYATEFVSKICQI